MYKALLVDEKIVDLKLNVDLSVNVIDGGFFLYRTVVKWSAGLNFAFIFNQYVTYLKKHYGRYCIVVIDETMNSIRRTEQEQKSTRKTLVDINFSKKI